MAMLAPIVGAAGLWLVTGTAMALAFAALGPIVALASVLDGRRQARRIRRRGEAERQERLAELHAAIDESHRVERSGAWLATPATRRRLAADRPLDWRDDEPGTVLLGSGPVPSTLRIDGQPLDGDDHAVIRHAGRVDDAPVVGSLTGSIGIVGPLPLARAAARAVLLQLAHRCRPGRVELLTPSAAEWAWAAGLPHVGGGGACRILVVDPVETQVLERHAREPAAVVALAGTIDELPAAIETLVIIESPRRALIEVRGTSAGRRPVVPELLGEAESAACVVRLREAAAREKLGSGSPSLPRRLALADLAQSACAPETRSSLRAAVGMSSTGRLELDLAGRGPHAIVAGTTGSGKSEFLLAWIAAMAVSYPPDRVAFLLVDFKGGAAFEPVRGLPHVTGIVTDLDEDEAERAVRSLRAELTHRESVLMAERVRDISDLPAGTELARLVIVLDEFQAVIERFPDLGVVVADIAARGRSLGMHLVLASQRPNGVVREQVSANCPIRVSLRVMQPADSLAIVGTDAAARIPADAPGRAIADTGDGAVVEFQSAQLDERTLVSLRNAGRDMARARRPWVDPLPARVTADLVRHPADTVDGAVEGIVIGLLDVPERQRHELAAWSPSSDGPLLVLGAPRSGRSTVLAAVAQGARERGIPLLELGGSPSAQWDALHETLAELRSGRGGAVGLLVVDDLDLRFRDWPDDYRQAAMTALESLIREGAAGGLIAAGSAGAAHRLPAQLREAFTEVALLRHPSRGELVHAGGVGELWRPRDRPGAGQWRGHRAQFLDAPRAATEPRRAARARLAIGSEVWAVVASSVPSTVDGIRGAGVEPMVLRPGGDADIRAALAAHPVGPAAPLVIVGDAEAWSGSWAVAALVRDSATIVVRGGARELRMFVAPSATLPPLIDEPASQCWVIGPSATVRRAAWPPHRGN